MFALNQPDATVPQLQQMLGGLTATAQIVDSDAVGVR